MNKQQIDEILDKIIKRIEETGELPWQKPWNKTGMPLNLVSKKRYHGLNLFLLAMSPFKSRYWVTYLQAKELGGNVKRGALGTPILKMGFFEKATGEITKNESGEDIEVMEDVPYFKLYTVFNLDQCEGIENPEAEIEFNLIEKAESIVNGYKKGPKILYSNQGRAFYASKLDVINLPHKESFKSVSGFYATLFHELTHSTGHASRLNREGITEEIHFGSETYSKEELIAEMGAAFLCGEAGIENTQINNSSAYIKSWLKALKDDKSLLVTAASKARKAVEHIMG